jgi:hypothetical protein
VNTNSIDELSGRQKTKTFPEKIRDIIWAARREGRQPADFVRDCMKEWGSPITYEEAEFLVRRCEPL